MSTPARHAVGSPSLGRRMSPREERVARSERIKRLNTTIGQAILALQAARQFLFPDHKRYYGADRIPDDIAQESQVAAEVQQRLDQLAAIDNCITRLRSAKKSFARGKWAEGAQRLKLAGKEYPTIWFNWDDRAGDSPEQELNRRLYMGTRDTADNIALITDLVDALGINLEQGASP